MRSDFHIRVGPDERTRVFRNYGITYVVASSFEEAARMMLELTS
jgi:hypothetical protein